MIINDNSKVIYFENEVATPEETSHLPIDSAQIPGRSFLININGEIYFAKAAGIYGLTNELIGSYLSKKIGLDTVDYQIGKTNKSFFALSKPFYEEGYDYVYLKEYFNIPNYSWRKKSSLSNFRFFPKSLFQARLCSTEGLDLIRESSVYDSILKLIAVDLKMGQFDRHGGNLQVKVGESLKPKVAPIYDYGSAYVLGNEESIYCCSSLVWVRRNKKSINELIRRHPDLMNYLEQLQDISMYTILDDICEEKEIDFTGDEFYNYIRSQKIIDRTLNKVKVK